MTLTVVQPLVSRWKNQLFLSHETSCLPTVNIPYTWRVPIPIHVYLSFLGCHLCKHYIHS